MPIIRANALRSFQASFRTTASRATARVAAPARTQLIAKRFNSSGGSSGHGHGEPSSDLPWLLTALVVTPPATWYLWPEESHDSGHHGDSHGEEHAEKSDEAEEEAPKEEEAPAEEEKSDEKSEDSEKPDDKEEKSEEKDEESEEKDEKEEKSEEKEDKDEKTDDKPAEKKGSDSTTSSLAKKQGEDANASTSASKPKGKSQGDITVKQGGMSNTDTKHSTKIDSAEKSTKGDGNPETAKSKGTVDPNAPVK